MGGCVAKTEAPVCDDGLSYLGETTGLETESDFSERVQDVLNKVAAYQDSIRRHTGLEGSPSQIVRKGVRNGNSDDRDMQLMLQAREGANDIREHYLRHYEFAKKVLLVAETKEIRSIEVCYTSIGPSCFGKKRDVRNTPPRLAKQLLRDVFVFSQASIKMEEIQKSLKKLDKVQKKVQKKVDLLPGLQTTVDGKRHCRWSSRTQQVDWILVKKL